MCTLGLSSLACRLSSPVMPAAPTHTRVTNVADLPTEGRINDETAKWIDQAHVERSETTHRLHIDCQVERIAPRAWRERERQEGMHSRIAKLAEGFLTRHVEHSKPAFASPRSNLRLRAIRFSKAIDVRSA